MPNCATWPYSVAAATAASLCRLIPGYRPHERQYPAYQRASQEEIEQEDGQGIAVMPYYGDYGRGEVECQQQQKNYDADEASEQELDECHEPSCI